MAGGAQAVDVSAPGLGRIARLMEEWGQPWAVAGGWAIELFCALDAGPSRPHKDVDVAVLRRDQLSLQAHLTEHGWAPEIAFKGTLTPWADGEYIERPRHILWCWKPGHDPDFLEVLLNEADATRFLFRRDTSIARALDRAFLRSASGLPVLAPEIVLLYKATDAEDPDSGADFRLAAPRLDAAQRAWLAAAIAKLNPHHLWLADL